MFIVTVVIAASLACIALLAAFVTAGTQRAVDRVRAARMQHLETRGRDERALPDPDVWQGA